MPKQSRDNSYLEDLNDDLNAMKSRLLNSDLEGIPRIKMRIKELERDISRNSMKTGDDELASVE